MAKSYTVQSGDTLGHIAEREGYPSWRDIYYHPDNAAFRVQRPNPDYIHPGDVLLLPDKPGTVTSPPDGTKFALFFMRDPEDKRIAKVIVGRIDNGARDVVTYRLQPRSFAEAMARKVCAQNVRGLDFQAPEPMTTRSFNGSMLLTQLPVDGVSRLNFTANRRNGGQIPLSFEFITDSLAKQLVVGPGLMALDEADRARPEEPFVRRMVERRATGVASL